LYTDATCFYLQLNDALRNGKDISTYAGCIYYLFSALKKIPTTKSPALYRGVKPTEATPNVQVLVQNQCLVGSCTVWPCFTSASVAKYTAQTYSNYLQVGKQIHRGVIFQINAVTGRDIQKYSAITYEGELLFLPGTHLYVKSIQIDPEDGEDEGARCLIVLEERPNLFTDLSVYFQ